MSDFGTLLLHKEGSSDQQFSLNKPLVTLGRATTNDIVLTEARVSRQHARFEVAENALILTDLGSANGVWLNDVRVHTATAQPGDRIEIGGYTLDYLGPSAEPAFEPTLIESEAELERTLALMAVPVALNDTSQPRLAIQAPDRTWEILFDVDSVTIGRNADNHLMLDYQKVSRNHAVVERRGERFILKDLGSTNGTLIDGRRIDQHALQNGETFQVGPVRLVFKSGFEQQEMTLEAGLDLGSRAGPRPVIFVPGIMGSQLYLGSERVWPNIKLLFENPDLLKYSESTRIVPNGILQEVVIVPNLISIDQYNLFGNYLTEEMGYERGRNFIEFAYDWRQDIRKSAAQLAALVDSWDVKGPITLIGHSLGTLVSRYYVEKVGGKNRVDRLMLLGGPHQGVPKICANLLTGVDVLPFGLMGRRLTEVIESFQTVYQILPAYPCGVDQNGQEINFLEDDGWVKPNYRAMHRIAGEFRRELGMATSVPTLSVFGYGLKTASRLHVRRDSGGVYREVKLEVELTGDDSVPERSAMLAGTEIHPVQQNHGTLFNDNDVKMRLRLELLKPR